MGILSGVVAHVLTEAAATSKHTRATIETKLQELGAAVSPRLASARVTHVVLVRTPSNGSVTAARATEELWQLFQKLDKACLLLQSTSRLRLRTVSTSSIGPDQALQRVATDCLKQ